MTFHGNRAGSSSRARSTKGRARTGASASGRVGAYPGGGSLRTFSAAGGETAMEIGGADAMAIGGGAAAMVIGGGEIYAQAMPLADRLYISHVALAPEGDTLFPPIDPSVWEVVDAPEVPLTGRDSAAFSVRVYARRTGLFR